MVIKKILVPVDFSIGSLQALDQAATFASGFGAALSLLHVAEPLYYAADLGLQLEEQLRSGREQLTALEAQLKRRGLKCRVQVETGVPYQVIVDEAQRGGADLIIMATHGRTGLSHLLMGSVTDKVVRTATCPVLTVHLAPPRARKRPR